VAGGDRLSDAARFRIGGSRGNLLVSAITAFEIGVKCRKGALSLPLPPGEWYERALEFHGIREVPVSGRIAVASTSLPALHADPCDRMIVATAALLDLTILTPDPLIQAYGEARSEW
jgi:PIN domain nuclease of toxin-antitoxin system